MLPRYLVAVGDTYRSFYHRRRARRFVNSLSRRDLRRARVLKPEWFVIEF
jgi:hypothetical protein